MSLAGKVALVTGGSSGIGECCVEEFLQNGIKGVVIADINNALGAEVAKKFNEKYGDGRAIFVSTDVADKNSFENAFEKAVEKYNSVDILVNNAGIADEVNWEKTLQVNLFGTTYGCLLAINKYFPKYKSGPEAFIINISSASGISPIAIYPHYSSSKSAILGLTRSFGINKTITEAGIRVMAVCPELTETPILENINKWIVYKELFEDISQCTKQKPSSVAKCVTKAIEEAENGKIWFVNEDVVYRVNFPSIETIITAS